MLTTKKATTISMQGMRKTLFVVFAGVVRQSQAKTFCSIKQSCSFVFCSNTQPGVLFGVLFVAVRGMFCSYSVLFVQRFEEEAGKAGGAAGRAVSYTHLRAHETDQ